jgi:hypothetical protein
MDCLTLKNRLDVLRTERSTIEGIWELIEQFVVPFRAKFFTDDRGYEGSMNWRRRELYDSTAVDANQNLSSNLQSGLTNPAYRWFSLIFRDKTLMKDRTAVNWLEESANRVFLALQESNFDLEVNETFLDLTSFGTSILTEEVEETNGEFTNLIFSSIPLSQGWYEFNHLNAVWYFYRQLQWTAAQIKSKWPETTLPDKVQDKLDNKKDPGDKFSVIYAVFPREDKIGVDVGNVIAPLERPFGFKYFMYEDAEIIGEEGGYYEMPAFVPRWRKTAGSTYGHSPAMVVLSDILTLNQLVEMILKANEKAIDPPVLTTRRGVFGDIDLTAGGATVVATLESIKAFESQARFDVGALTKEDLQTSIRKAFFEDQLQLKESPQMTATEVQTRFEMMARLIGPSLGRIQNDLHSPLVSKTFNALFRYKRLPEPPPAVTERQAQIDIEFIGPMARAQKMDKVTNIERWVANLAQLSEVLPEILDNVDSDAAATETAHYLTVPPEVVRTKAAILKIRKDRAAKIEAQEKMAMATQGSEMVKNLGAAGGGGNGGGLEDVLGGAGEQTPV